MGLPTMMMMDLIAVVMLGIIVGVTWL